jgi:murein DD-endopeptidase MepM/ murein hydrolase activator NlpD
VQGDAGQLEYLRSLVQQSMEGVQARIAALDEVIWLQQEAIAGKIAEIENLEARIEYAEAEIEVRYMKIEVHSLINEENKAKFAEHVKNNYMSGNQGYIDIFMNATDFFDMIVRADVMRKAGERNTEFMENLLEAMAEQERMIEEQEELKKQLAADKLNVEQEKAQLEEDLAALYVNMANLDAEKAERQQELLGYAADIAELQSSINSMWSQHRATAAEIEAIEREVEDLIRARINLDRPDYSGDGFRWPLESRFRMITDTFGWTSSFGGRQHYGIDIGNSGIRDSNIYAIQSGTVIKAVESNSRSGYGSQVIIDHGGGVTSLYAHMVYGSVAVSEGQTVTKHDIIGRVGSTGFSTGPHLHFGIYVNGSAVNPLNYTFEYY